MFDEVPKADDRSSKRRRVLKGLMVTGVAMAAAPFVYAAEMYLSYRGSPMTGASVKLSSDDLTPSAPWKLLDISGDPVIVVHEAELGIRAFTATCTHLGCTVSYRPATEDFYCKCHHGRFDKNGVNVPGTKPPEPLTELKVTQEANNLEVFLTPLRVKT